MGIKLTNLDVSEYLDTEESIASYLSAVIEDGDPQLLLSAISDVAKARGMAKIASDSGLGRESLYKALKPESKPRFETVLKVLNSLGVKMQFNALHEIEKNAIKITKSINTVKNKTIRKNSATHSRARKVKSIIENSK
jgi:probable addiction module antidote protein